MVSPVANIEAVPGHSINAEFVRLTVVNGPDAGVYTFSSSFKVETLPGEPDQFNPGTTGGVTYTPLGGLIGVSGNQRDLSVTSFDTSISIGGIDPVKMGRVIDADLKGSKIEIWRGFYNSNFVLTTVSKRYTGIVTGYSLQEDRVDRIDTFTLALHCSSYKKVLENRHAGRFTNSQSWNQLIDNTDPAYDKSMDGVAAINPVVFPFGQKLA